MSPPFNKRKMNCWHCKTELIWGGDHDVEDDCFLSNEYLIESNLHCPHCGTFVLVYYPKEPWHCEKEEEKKEFDNTEILKDLQGRLDKKIYADLEEEIERLSKALIEIRDIARASDGVEFYAMLADNALGAGGSNAGNK